VEHPDLSNRRDLESQIAVVHCGFRGMIAAGRTA
jgi:hypothetical protein